MTSDMTDDYSLHCANGIIGLRSYQWANIGIN